MNSEDNPTISSVPRTELNTDPSTWEGWINTIVLWAAQNPWEFLYYIFMGLSPIFLISLLLSWKLAKALESQEKDRKKKIKRENNIAKAKRSKSD
jgi:hypothetical protein